MFRGLEMKSVRQNMKQLSHSLALIVALCALALSGAQACSASKTGGIEDDGSGTKATTSTSGAGASTSTTSGVGGGFGTSSSSSSGAGGMQECAETESVAKEGLAPADIILAVDTSGSMSAEAKWTQ